MNHFKIVYYALLRQQRGLAEERVSSNAQTARDLYIELKELHQFQLAESQLQVAVNAEIVPWQTSLKDGDSILFIPPVAGG
ncbi:MAG: MoaD/ThiS family protein [Rhabdochlamydiaceae bacterium]|nr:MoaD/ThiS family protein [Rhabdochlamydiaceae bacterium]